MGAAISKRGEQIPARLQTMKLFETKINECPTEVALFMTHHEIRGLELQRELYQAEWWDKSYIAERNVKEYDEYQKNFDTIHKRNAGCWKCRDIAELFRIDSKKNDISSMSTETQPSTQSAQLKQSTTTSDHHHVAGRMTFSQRVMWSMLFWRPPPYS